MAYMAYGKEILSFLVGGSYFWYLIKIQYGTGKDS